MSLFELLNTMRLVMLVLPPVLALLLVVQIATATSQKDEQIKALVDKAAETETNAARELLELEYILALSNTLVKNIKTQSIARETSFSIEYNASSARMEELWEEFRKEQERIKLKLAKEIKEFKVSFVLLVSRL
jgi:hypothetical protein